MSWLIGLILGCDSVIMAVIRHFMSILGTGILTGGLATQDDTTKFIGALTIVLSIGWSIMKALIAKRAKVAAVASPVGHATRMFPLLLCTVHYCPVKLLLTTRSAL